MSFSVARQLPVLLITEFDLSVLSVMSEENGHCVNTVHDVILKKHLCCYSTRESLPESKLSNFVRLINLHTSPVYLEEQRFSWLLITADKSRRKETNTGGLCSCEGAWSCVKECVFVHKCMQGTV